MLSSTTTCVVVAAVALLASIAAPAFARPVQGPSFCHGLDCPTYQVLNSSSNYEVRAYNRSMWARTHITGQSFDVCQETGFMRLFNYISGNNVDKEKIAMTTPVLISMLANDSLTHDVSFMVPFKNQPNPPAPSASNIYLTHDEPHVSYVGTFSGFATSQTLKQAVSKLTKALDSNNVRYNRNVYHAAIYDGPYKLFNRHNEVWFDAI